MIREYPKEIQECIKIYDPYKHKIKDGVMTNAPKEAIKAYEQAKKWVWEQEQ